MPVILKEDHAALGDLADVYRELMIDNPRDGEYQEAYVEVITALALCELVHVLRDIALDTKRL